MFEKMLFSDFSFKGP